MHLILISCLVGSTLALNLPSTGTDPCAVSPCAKDAVCERTRNGLAVCNCKVGFVGDAFVSCHLLSGPEVPGNIETGHKEQSNARTELTTVKIGSVSTQPASANREVTATTATNNDKSNTNSGFTIDFQVTSDYSRVPMLGPSTSATTAHHNNMNVNYNPRYPIQPPPMTSVPFAPPIFKGNYHNRNNNNFQTQPMSHFQLPHANRNPNPNSNFEYMKLNTFTKDPLGQYSNCRNINGIVVCADNSVDDEPNASVTSPLSHGNPIDFQNNHRPLPHSDFSGNSHQSSNRNDNFGDMSQNRSPIPNYPQHPLIPHRSQNMPSISSSGSSQNGDCKSMCGVGSVCRLVLGRPVCGCPAGHTGDPGVRCDPIMKESQTAKECQKHTDCSSKEICAEYHCVDPCNDNFKDNSKDHSQDNQNMGMCGRNARCMVIEHTPICGCTNGFYGNPYVACVA